MKMIINCKKLSKQSKKSQGVGGWMGAGWGVKAVLEIVYSYQNGLKEMIKYLFLRGNIWMALK